MNMDWGFFWLFKNSFFLFAGLV